VEMKLTGLQLMKQNGLSVWKITNEFLREQGITSDLIDILKDMGVQDPSDLITIDEKDMKEIESCYIKKLKVKVAPLFSIKRLARIQEPAKTFMKKLENFSE
jgi:hypothetical protein